MTLEQSEIRYWAYWYSSELSTFNMRIKPQEFKDKRNIEQRIVILNIYDLAGSSVLRIMIEWGWLDIDSIMANQVMATFYRQKGYLYRNDTEETWAWTGGSGTDVSYSYY